MRLSKAGIRLSLDQGRFRAGFLGISGSIFWWNLRFIRIFIGFSVGRPMALHCTLLKSAILPQGDKIVGVRDKSLAFAINVFELSRMGV
jgi:hypothetical protein